MDREPQFSMRPVAARLAELTDAQGHELGSSLCAAEDVELARQLLASDRGTQLELPVDLVVADRLDAQAQSKTIDGVDVPTGMMGLDIAWSSSDARDHTDNCTQLSIITDKHKIRSDFILTARGSQICLRGGSAERLQPPRLRLLTLVRVGKPLEISSRSAACSRC
jgi:hypothetical protein